MPKHKYKTGDLVIYNNKLCKINHIIDPLLYNTISYGINYYGSDTIYFSYEGNLFPVYEPNDLLKELL